VFVQLKANVLAVACVLAVAGILAFFATGTVNVQYKLELKRKCPFLRIFGEITKFRKI
jgi:hypothetical protein